LLTFSRLIVSVLVKNALICTRKRVLVFYMINRQKRLFGLLVFVFICFMGIGQQKANEKSIDRAFHKAINYAELQDYEKAIDGLKAIVKEVPDFSEAYLHLGLCYLNTNTGADSAIVAFKLGLSSQSAEEQYSRVGQDFYMLLGKAYQITLQPDSALMMYGQILASTPDIDAAFEAEIRQEMQMCKNAKIFLANPIELSIENLGENVNSKYDDHSPLVNVYENLLLFTSRRPSNRLPKLDDGQYPEKVYSTVSQGDGWQKAEALKVFFRNIEHESGLSLCADGNTLFIYRNDNEGKSIYMSSYDNEKWQEPVKLPYPINTEFNETHASLSSDRSTLFFTSDRDGGIGGIDIYMCKKGHNGEWGEVRNLGPAVNTRFDEETSMIHPDGQTLYFASEGHNSMGRMDVFYTQMNVDSTWVEPVNLGYPINTPDDDFFFLPTMNKSEAYYASARFEDNYGGTDIYRVEFNESFEGELAVIEGQVTDQEALKKGSLRIMVTRRTDQRLVGDYRPNKKDGKYTMFLEAGHEYDIEQRNEIGLIEESLLNVAPEMVYEKESKVFTFEEIRMEPPLKHMIAKKDLKSKNKEVITDIKDDIKQIEGTEYYTIQVLALKRLPLFASRYLKGLDVEDLQIVKCKDGFTRYIYGAYADYNLARTRRRHIMQMSKYEDSFVRRLSDLDDLRID